MDNKTKYVLSSVVSFCLLTALPHCLCAADDTSSISDVQMSGQSADPDQLKKWQSLSGEQKQALRERYNRLKSLSPEQRGQLKERFQRFRALAPEKQAKAKANWQKFKNMPTGQKQVLQERLQHWQSFSPQERAQLKQKMERFRTLPSADKQRLQQQHERWQNLSADQKQELRQRLQQKKAHRQNLTSPERRKILEQQRAPKLPLSQSPPQKESADPDGAQGTSQSDNTY